MFTRTTSFARKSLALVFGLALALCAQSAMAGDAYSEIPYDGDMAALMDAVNRDHPVHYSNSSRTYTYNGYDDQTSVTGLLDAINTNSGNVSGNVSSPAMASRYTEDKFDNEHDVAALFDAIDSDTQGYSSDGGYAMTPAPRGSDGSM